MLNARVPVPRWLIIVTAVIIFALAIWVGISIAGTSAVATLSPPWLYQWPLTVLLVAPLAIVPFARRHVFGKPSEEIKPRANLGDVSIGLIVLALGLCTIMTLLSWRPPGYLWLWLAAVVYLLAGAIWTFACATSYMAYSEALAKYDATVDAEEIARRERQRLSEQSIDRFNRALVLLGALLLIGSIACCILLSGLAQREQIEGRLGRLLLLAAGNALLGAVFFTANTCRLTRMRIERGLQAPLRFSLSKFWGGTWFRLGEAVLFMLVIFHVLWLLHDEERATQTTLGLADLTSYKALPLLALLLGMFVKQGERLIQGIRQKIFEKIIGLVAEPEAPPTGEPRPDQAETQEEKKKGEASK